MDRKLVAIIGVTGIAVIGLAAVAMNGRDNGEAALRPAVIAEMVTGEQGSLEVTSTAQKEFQSMAVGETGDACVPPFVPSDIDDNLLTRSSYAQIMRILAAQRWEESGSCDCSFGGISWEDVIEAAPQFVDGADTRLNPAALRKIANEIEGRRALACDS